ncbi:GNAT family N-acetyltransferase [uncultured Ilyobacter sp.]|uniref:GNAT family N-acetyltransferase n=1 Tax=uncultured Ilyobacter sp. TaxID=544433 RepID=UPI0029C95CA6|nr:GNAT family N-acetyltransferase [uncultured Ilyobacter sp.]
MIIRYVEESDAESIAEIYNYYVENTAFTGDETPFSEEHMKNRIRDISKDYPWLVLEENSEILGYIYINQWRFRSSYRHSAELSIYIRDGVRTRGLGSKLFTSLLEKLKEKNLHAIISAIVLPNDASISLHEKFGFKKVAHFTEVGYKFEKWLDLGYWELIL